MTKEIWKDIRGYEGMYQVSNLGCVKSLSRVVYRSDGTNSILPEKIMKPSKNTYLYARLRKNGINKHLAIHRLVCEAFIENPLNLPCVNHKDNNPLNNHISNLEWCTYHYNNNYGTHSERLSNAMVDKYGAKIDMYTKDGLFVKSFNSIRDAVNEGFTRDSISKCCRGKLNSHNGYVFRYKGEQFSYINRKGNTVVKKFNNKGELIEVYLSINDAASKNGLKKDKLIYMKNNGVLKPINGFIYKFE